MRIVSFSFRHADADQATIKHQSFVNSPMGNKSVTALPGIGEVWGQQLKAKGFGQASQIFGQYLVLAKDGVRFTSWIRQLCGIDEGRAWRVYSALEEWSQQYFN